MKKTSKILILVLSLALVFGMLAIVSGAESESVVLTQDTVDAANGVITFESDVTVESVINLNGDLTLNLNGYTLTVEKDAYFKYVANSNFTVNGPGEINCGLFAYNVDGAVGNLNINGVKDQGIAINQHGSDVRFLLNKKGTVKVDNVYFVSDSPYSTGGCETVVFDTDGSGNEVNFKFTNSSFVCETAANYNLRPTVYLDDKGTEDTSDDTYVDSELTQIACNSFVQVGSKGTLTMDNCNVDFEGIIVHLASSGKSRTDDIVTVTNSVLDAYTDAPVRTFVYYGGQSYSASGWVVTKNSAVGSTYGITMNGWNSGQLVNDTINLMFENCTISNYGVNHGKKINSQSGGTVSFKTEEISAGITGNSDVILKNCRYLTVNGNLVGRSGNAFVTVGTRSNVKYGTNITLFYKEDTSLEVLKNRKAEDSITTVDSGDGITTKYTVSEANTGIKWVFDPVGDPDAPWVAVPADSEFTSSWLTGNDGGGKWFQNYEGIRFVLSNDTWATNKTDFAVSDYKDGLLQPTTIRIATSAFGSSGNGTSVGQSNSNGTGLQIYGYNVSGNWSLVKTAENNYMKWYVPVDPANPDNKVAKASNGKTPNLFLTPYGHIATKASGAKVAVYDVSLSTDGKFPDGSLYLEVRTSSPSNAAYLYITDNVLTVGTGYTRAKDFPAEGIDISNGWYHFTFINYFDLNANQSAGKGSALQIVYLNGVEIARTTKVSTSATADYGTWDIRYDTSLEVGATFNYDNMSARLFSELQPGEQFASAPGAGDGVYKPELYVYQNYGAEIGNNNTKPVARLGGQYYYDLGEALEAAKTSAFGVALIKDYTGDLNVEEVTKIWGAGNTLSPKNITASIFTDYNNDGEEDGFYTVDPTKKVPYAFATVLDADENVVEYKTGYFFIGEVPFMENVAPNKLVKKGQELWQNHQSAWIDYCTEEAPVALTETDYWSFYADPTMTEEDFEYNLLEFYRANPVFAEEKLASNISMITVDKNGIIKNTITETAPYGGSSTNSNSIYGLNPAYGDTVIIAKNNIKLRGTLKAHPRLADGYDYGYVPHEVPASERWWALDLNGYNLVVDGTDGGADQVIPIMVNVGDSFNLYSSVAGARIDIRGASGGEKAYACASAMIYNTDMYPGSPAKILTDKAKDASVTDYGWAEFYAQMQSGAVDGFGGIINAGTATAFDGNKYNGSNMTVYCDGFYYSSFSDSTAQVNIDDLMIYKMGYTKPFVKFEGYNGTLNLTNFEIIDSSPADKGSSLVYSTTSAAYYMKDEYAAKPVANIHGGSFLTNHGGMWMVTGEAAIGKLHFEDFVSNGAIMGDNSGVNNVWVGNNVICKAFTNISDKRPDYYVNFDEGINYGRINYTLDPFTVKTLVATHNKTDGSNHYYNFEIVDSTYTPEGTIVWASTDKPLVPVTVTGVNGVSNTVNYVPDGNVLAGDFTNLGAVNGTVTNLAFAGTFNGGVTFPAVAKETVTYVADTTVTNVATGFLQNVSLYTELGFNVYVPYKYADLITSITVDGVKVEGAPVVTVNGEQYYKLTIGKNVTELNDDVVVTVNFEENGVATAKTYTLTVNKYINAIKAGEFSAEEKALMDYIVNFAYEAEMYFNEGETQYTKPEVAAIEKTYTALTEDEMTAIAKIFATATINLNGSAPVYEFEVAEGFNGTVTINGKATEVKAGDKIVVDDLRAYNFLKGVTVEAEGATVTFKFENYAAQAGEAVKALVDAIYDYCYAAEIFKNA